MTMAKKNYYGLDEITSLVQDSLNMNEDMQLTKDCIKKVLKYNLLVMKAVLEADNEIELHEFGQFHIVDRSSYNSLTKTDIGPRRYVTFKSSKVLKRMINAKAVEEAAMKTA